MSIEKKIIRVGYFTHTNISPSETFIYDLVKGLNEEDTIDLTFVSGKTDKVNVDFDLKSKSIGFEQKNKKASFYAYKIGQILGGNGYKFKQKIQFNTANTCLSKAKLSHFDVAYVEYATSAVLLMPYFKANNIPFVVHVHGFDITAARLDSEYSKKLEELFVFSSNIITPSKHLKRYLILLGCNPDKIEVIYPFSLENSLDNKSWKNRYLEAPSVTFLGRLTEKKNPIALLYAFKIVLEKLPNVKLNILGDGPLLAKCNSVIKKLGIENSIVFYGVVKRETAFEVLNKTWVYAQHSVTSITGDQEGFPVSLAEAAAHALPLVSTIHSGITENIIEGKTGFLVQEYNYELMAEKIIFLIKNPELAEEMGENGRKHIMELCKPKKRVEKIKELLIQVSKQNNKIS
ncbi:glycosyltransferase family 4 protein [Winogradskyella sp. PAMC22761]|nr:glycosyltransferase family 4 protein [Winogradskyella sp. PAMC22761]